MAPRIVEILVTGNASQAISELEKLTGATAASAEKMSGYTKFGGVALAAIMTLAVGVAAEGVKAAEEFQGAHARLVTAIDNSHSTWKVQSAAVEELDSKMRALGFTDTNTEANLSTLVNATHNAKKATEDMALAADAARARHIDLASAVALLAKVETGHVALLGRLGINVKDATGATISQEEAIKRLSAMYGGQASAYAQTFQGKIDQLKATFDKLEVTVGQAVIPVIESLASAVAGTVEWFEKHKTAAEALGAVMAAIVIPAMVEFIALQIETVILKGAEAAGFLFGKMQLLGQGAIEATVGLRAMTAAELAAASAASLGLIAVGALVYAFMTSDGPYERATAAGKKWADQQLISAKATNDEWLELTQLKNAQEAIKPQIDSLTAAIKRQSDTKNGGKIVSTEVQAQIDKENFSLIEAKKKYDELTPTIKRLQKAHEEASLAAEYQAEVIGVKLKDATKQSTAELKLLAKATTDASDVFGDATTKMLLDAGISGSALEGIAKSADTMDKGIASAVTSSLNSILSLSKDGAEVSEADMEKSFTASVENAKKWAVDMQTLISEGINQGIVKQFGDAGPKSEPELQAFLKMVEVHGKEWVNSQRQSADDVVAAVTGAVDQSTAAAAKASLPPIVLPFTASFSDQFYQAIALSNSLYAAQGGSGLNAFGDYFPGFATGGTVPGPIGAPMLAVVHGGEYVDSTGMGGDSGGATYNINVTALPGGEAEAGRQILRIIKQANLAGIT